MSATRKRPANRARAQARLCVMQALYQWQMTNQNFVEIRAQFATREEFAGADTGYFDELLQGCIERHQELAGLIGGYADRPWEQLDPIERALLLMGMFELIARLDVPYRVVVNEAVELCKRFGATDAYKYVNAVLDKAARDQRAAERV